MLLKGKPISGLDVDTLQRVLADETLEDRTLDFKTELPEDTPDGKREFLRDVSAFANTSGGFILYGVGEDQGKAVSLPGLGPLDQEAKILWLTQILQSGITPRILGIQFKAVELTDDNWVIAVYIPKSWAVLHRVTFATRPGFYARNSRGKYDLSVDELRTAFTTAANLGDRLREYRLQRLAKIVGGETPVPLMEQPKVVLHLLPIAALESVISLDPATVLQSQQWREVYMLRMNWHRVNFDGVLGFQDARAAGQPRSAWHYAQIYRNGAVEIADAFTLRHHRDGDDLIDYHALEDRLIGHCKRVLLAQEHAGIEPPITIFVSMLGVAGYRMSTRLLPPVDESEIIDRDDLFLPEVWLNDYPEDAPSLVDELKPMFDALWNAVGFPEWLTYENCRDRSVGL